MKLFGKLACLPGLLSLAVHAAAELPIGLSLDGPDRVGRHEKVEFKLRIDRLFANPYDPDEADVSVEFTTPSGKTLAIPAFFHQPYEFQLVPRQGRPTEWLHPSEPPGWRARFAPEETGRYSAAAILRHGGRETRSGAVSFEAVPKPSRGYVRVSKTDPRYFEFSDGTPFFPIGQNVAFVGTGQYLDTERAIGVFRKMSGHGANFARIWTCSEDWAMAIEARKSAWGRSWSWRPPFATIPGNEGYHSAELAVRLGGTNAQQLSVSPTQPVALRPGTQYRLGAKVLTEPGTTVSVQFGSTPLGEPAGSDKRGQWSTFHQTLTADANQWWLGDFTLRANGPGQVWLRDLSLQEVGGGPELLWEADPNRSPRGYYNQTDSFMLDRLLDAAATNGLYLQLCLLTRDHYRFALRDPNTDAYGRSSHMEQDRHNVHFHNAQWASALSGLSGGAFFWWWEVLDKNHAYPRYRPVAHFVADIPFTTAQLEPLSISTEQEQARVVALRGKDRAYAWIFNPQSAWWKLLVAKTKPAAVKNDSFTLDELIPGAYRIEWWDTETGKIIGERTAATEGGKLQMAIPDFESDIACKIIRR